MLLQEQGEGLWGGGGRGGGERDGGRGGREKERKEVFAGTCALNTYSGDLGRPGALRERTPEGGEEGRIASVRLSVPPASASLLR